MLAFFDYVCASSLKSLNLILHVLPITFTLWIARRLGGIAYLANPERRAIGYTNLRAAFCESKTPAELKRLNKKVYQNLVQVFVEIMSLTKVDEKYIDKYIDIKNAHNMLKIAEHPRGIILLAAHFGNWELSAVASALKGFPALMLAREQSMKRVNALLDKLRESKGMEVVRKGITTRYIVKALHQGKILGIAGDQNAGKAGVFTEFFGRPASTASGAARFAQKTGAFILPAFMARIKGPYHSLVIEEPVKVEKGADIMPHLAKYNATLEKHVRMHPEQWLWLHRRWKSTPLKKVIIISDGKPGHVNQSLALCKELKRYREHSGHAPVDTIVDILEVKFKNSFAAGLFRFLAFFSGEGCRGCMKCLKLCLARDSYESLSRKYADIIVSAGSAVAGVNRIFSIENNAKSACVMKPPFVGFGKFDMVVLPRHDGKCKKEGAVIATDTVPNLIDEECLREGVRKISKIIKLEKGLTIGALLGGDNKDFMLTDGVTGELLENLKGASQKLNANLLFTTSRRTPRSAEILIKAKLSPEKRCKLLVIANEKNIPHAAGGILGLADIVVTSGESASMVSEAVESGKKVIVFRLKKKKKVASKFERMLKNLEKKGYIVTTDVGALSEAICEASSAPGPKNLPGDRFDVYKYMWRLGV